MASSWSLKTVLRYCIWTIVSQELYIKPFSINIVMKWRLTVHNMFATDKPLLWSSGGSCHEQTASDGLV